MSPPNSAIFHSLVNNNVFLVVVDECTQGKSTLNRTEARLEPHSAISQANCKIKEGIETYQANYEIKRSRSLRNLPSQFPIAKSNVLPSQLRTILIDWLVEVAEEYRLLPETLYLAVNCLDWYLSGNVITKQNLQLLGVSCMMIAAKYEEACVPQVESFCYITDNTYSRTSFWRWSLLF